MKPSKHKNQKVELNGQKFDSKREAKRWHELLILQRTGAISELCRQMPFILVPAVILNGRKKPSVKYIADFEYVQNGSIVVEDAKSPHLRTDPIYRLKKHLMKHVHGLEVIEV